MTRKVPILRRDVANGLANRSAAEMLRDLRMRLNAMPRREFPNDAFAVVSAAWGIEQRASSAWIARVVGMADLRRFHEILTRLTALMAERSWRDTVDKSTILAAMDDMTKGRRA